MIILIVEVLLVFILIMTFSTVIIDERKKRRRDTRLVRLKGYWEGGNRRSVDRLNVSLEVKYYENGTALDATSIDISTKGIRLLLDEKIETGTPLRLKIKIPGAKELIKTRGEVVWVEESKEDEANSTKRLFNTGIKFFRFYSPKDEEKLFNFITKIQR